ncbi:putative upf0589 protein [Phialemonium atrogriseum]|uniref:Upf0589 protein n=1 Tax=Phialemonium atrogriseum TaxID=1093897 RepID=A0AAJ0FKB9_9PEZI|nr:putative upf0589 protein [Phialemonium atrogriseum]KAK1765374.1 putative upf0589 protein [Phialemonium atrogriseum]
MAFPNIYSHRKVAETSARACEICFKLSTSVLVTPENKDFFYVCPSHLRDKGFCTPIIDQEAVEARKKKELEDEVARVKAEYEEKQRKKKEKEKEKKDGEGKGKGKGKGKDTKTDDDKSKDGEEEGKSETKSPLAEEEPRVFELKRTFYTQRVERKRQAEMARRNRERLQNPTFFPSVPKGLP